MEHLRSDFWVLTGITGHLTNEFISKTRGTNELIAKLREDNDFVCQNDLNQPLFFTKYAFPVEIVSSKVFRKKSALVIYMLEKKIGKDTFRKVKPNKQKRSTIVPF